MSFVVTAGRRAVALRSRCPTALLACAGGLATLLSCCVAALAPAIARAAHAQKSIFQDDQYLIYSGPTVADRTLAQLQSLGVQRIRVNVKWSTLTPDSASVTRPAGFDATNPADYPAGGWTRYDEVLVLAERHGIGVEFNITDPGPLWAMGQSSPTARAADHWEPSAAEFGQFVQALGTRYSGSYGLLPRVHDWSIWNEPNQPGWLAPQSLSHRGPQSPRLYRKYVDSAYRGLSASGHLGGRDTILIGELAPVGFSTPGFYTAIAPMPFMRSLYCVDSRYRPLTGSSAAALGCPTRGPRQAFVAHNAGLFSATGFAHHPYDFLLAPGKSSPQPSFVPIANLSRLEQGLDRAFRAYGVHRRIPLYLTEYGYQTRPPDPYQIVTLAEQAAYINQADYMAWRDPRVRSMAQFLLYDTLPDPRFRPQDFGYWDTFQTGLLFSDGTPKPAYDAYRMPIWIPSPRIRRGGRIFIWGQLRAAAHNVPQRAEIQLRPSGGAFRTIAVVSTRNPDGYLTSTVRLRATGELRIAWRSPSRGVLTSRSVAVRVG